MHTWYWHHEHDQHSSVWSTLLKATCQNAERGGAIIEVCPTYTGNSEALGPIVGCIKSICQLFLIRPNPWFRLKEKNMAHYVAYPLDISLKVLRVLVCGFLKSEWSWLSLWGSFNRNLKNCQYSTEGLKIHQNLAPVLVIILGILWHCLGKLLPVLVFTGADAPTRQHQ